ncbi:hypothetical protein [Psychrobacter sp.]|uniref:hypothetical protein n=1 Tax=Psychrobacter sp. TaxID=56811 RepID=UPI002648726E|nr:hypothetical protein [Psychrobacter sp.]MDN6275616.1 hypothetical protein [Psychrobacter sp.]MDN6308019.1 hypothetical protein [Psychrobacter sp.]
MSSLSNHDKKYTKSVVNISSALLLTTIALSMIGCSTTSDIKPTATVVVGAHTSL